VVVLPDSALATLYAATLALVRPDQIVAWRGTHADAADAVLAVVTGGAPASTVHAGRTPSHAS
jgi:hypothetical protein